MKNLKKLRIIFSVGSFAALAFSVAACGDDDDSSGGSTTAGTATTGGAGSGGMAATTGGAGMSAGGSAAGATTGGAGASTGGAGASTGGNGGSGGAKGGSGGTGGTGGASGGSGGSGGTGGGSAGPMCADTDDPATNKAATCTDFCNDWDTHCKAVDAAKYADKAACMTDCAKFSVAALCCRAYHVNNMPSADHCPHAEGMGPCAGK